MIELYQLKYSLASLFLIALFVCLVGVTWVKYFGGWYSKEPMSILELITSSMVISIVYLAFAGIVLALIPVGLRRVSAVAFIFIPIIFGVIRAIRTEYGVLFSVSAMRDLVFVVGMLLFCILVLIIASLKLPFPENLADGAYVNKEHVSAVRIQLLTGDLPADNVVPFVAEEYLARSISFINNSPILPGQQVTNRPILVSLVVLPFRLILRPVEALLELPKYNYVGSAWPDFRVLVRDEAAFSIFLGIGVFLNACLLLGVGLVFTKIKYVKWRHCVLLLLLFATSPYLLFQTVFTWPKSLAGFFIILSAFHYWYNKRIGLAAVLIGLAYLSHPYAIAYFIVAAAIIFFDYSNTRLQRIRNISIFATCFAMILVPWFMWSKLVIGIDSDLVQQNFTVSGVTPFQFLMARVSNLSNALLPTHLLNADIGFSNLFVRSSLNFSGAVGVVFIICMFVVKCLGSSENETHYIEGSVQLDGKLLPKIAVYCGVSSLLLTFVFSNPAVPILHGWQPFVALVITLGVSKVAKVGGIGEALCWMQVAVSSLSLLLFILLRTNLIGST